jgi:hypothetical protein
MTDRADLPGDDPIAGRFSDLPLAEADPRFRAALRRAFVEGDFGAHKQALRSPIVGWRWVGVAVAAGVLFVAVALLNRGPAWQVADATGAHTVLIDGRPYASDDRRGITHALRAEADIDVPADGRLDLEWPDVALFEVTGGTRITLPDRPGRWLGRAASCSVKVGEIRLLTGRDYPGTKLTIHTPNGMIVVTGTMLSVECGEWGTCVCVLEGTAEVGVNPDRLDPIGPGYRKVMYNDGTVEIIPVKAMHEEGLLDFERRMGARMDRPR